MDIAVELCTVGSFAFVVGGCGYYYLFRREKKDNLLDGPTPGSTVRAIRVCAGSMIDHVDFVFSDGFIASHGGDGGNRLDDFILNHGETVTCVRGRCGNFVDSIQFVLSTGRVSPIYGGPGGSTPFSFDIGEAIGGLSVSVSARGWLSRISGVWSVVDMTVPLEVAEASRSCRDKIRRHKILYHKTHVIPERKRYLGFMSIIVTYYLSCLSPVLTLWLHDDISLETWMDVVAAPAVSSGLENNVVWQQWQKYNQDVDSALDSQGDRDLDLDPEALSNAVNEALRKVVKKYGGYVRLPDIPQYDRSDGTWQVSGEWHELCMSRGNVEHQWLMIPYQQSQSAQELVSVFGVSDREKPKGETNLILVKGTKESVGMWSMVYWSERLAMFSKHILTLKMRHFPSVEAIADNVGGIEVGSPYVRYGMIREFQLEDWGTEDQDNQALNMPIFYVDTSFQPLALLFVFAALQICFTCILVELCLLTWGGPKYNPIYACLVGYTTGEVSLEQIVDEIESELSETASVTEVKWGKNTIMCSDTWLIVFRQFSMEAVRINDIRIESFKLVLRYSGSEAVEVTVLKIARSVNGYVRRFTLECPRDAFPRLRHAVIVQRRERALKAVKLELEAQLSSEWNRRQREEAPSSSSSSLPNIPLCLGDCGALANVRIVKRCTTCEERDECRCDPAWCHQCLLKWWIEKNTTKLEMGTVPTLAWQTRCPTCRVFFCLRDLAPTGPLPDSQSQVQPSPPNVSNAQQVEEGSDGEEEDEEYEYEEEVDEDDLTAMAIAMSLEQRSPNEAVQEEVIPSTSTADSTAASTTVGPSSIVSEETPPSPSELRRLRLARFDST